MVHRCRIACQYSRGAGTRGAHGDIEGGSGLPNWIENHDEAIGEHAMDFSEYTSRARW
jgi:hypothetical protein